MGIFEILKKRQDKSNDMDFADKQKQEIEQKEKFVSDLSCVELQGADWVEFAGILKREGVLSNSYIKQPSCVEISLDKNNRPKVVLEFKSKTSDSVRKVELFQDRACLYVNGAIEMYPETQRNIVLNKLWKDFQNRIRYLNMLETNREGYFHVRSGNKLMNKAKKMIGMKDIYDREQEFLEKYQDTVFDDFCYSAVFEMSGDHSFVTCVGELPKFVPLIENSEGKFVSGEPVIPFTPKTLEHCILHMTNGQKVEDGEYIDSFEKKCRDIQEYSCFESEDWDKVIEFGKEVVKSQYQVYVLNGYEMN